MRRMMLTEVIEHDSIFRLHLMPLSCVLCVLFHRAWSHATITIRARLFLSAERDRTDAHLFGSRLELLLSSTFFADIIPSNSRMTPSNLYSSSPLRPWTHLLPRHLAASMPSMSHRIPSTHRAWPDFACHLLTFGEKFDHPLELSLADSGGYLSLRMHDTEHEIPQIWLDP